MNAVVTVDQETTIIQVGTTLLSLKHETLSLVTLVLYRGVPVDFVVEVYAKNEH